MKPSPLRCRRAIHIGLRAGLIFIAGFAVVFAVLLRIALAISTDLEGFRTRFEELAFQVLGAGCGALFLWLLIHMFNRGENARGWAKRIAVVVVASAIYAASFGPACRLCEEGYLDGTATWLAYRPMTWLTYRGPRPMRQALWN